MVVLTSRHVARLQAACVFLGAIGCSIVPVHAGAVADPHPHTDQPISDFTFPPTAARPKFRYWLPDASVTADTLDADIAAIAAVSAGGIELLPFYNYGRKPISTDWSVYGFGTPAFADLFRSALNSTARHGLVLDFALGANQGAGVPSPAPPSYGTLTNEEYLTNGAGLAMELVYGAASLTAGQTIDSLPLPPPNIHFDFDTLVTFMNAPELWGGSGQLVALLAVQVEDQQVSANQTIVTLNQTSTVDLTDKVRNGTLGSWQVPSGAESESNAWQLIAFYQRYTYERSCVTVDNATTWTGNGSWMVDHFSAHGAKKMTDFWDQHLLDDSATRALLERVGEYSWEDSMEMVAALWWTPGFLDRFEQTRGYSAVPYLPVFFQATNAWNEINAPYNTTYVFSSASSASGNTFAEDYRLTLNEGYHDYLAHYQAWAAGYGLDHSCQPAYNLPLDMTADVPLVGAPELESLGFYESIENYLHFTGAAHLAGRNTVSTEIGAQSIGAYVMTVPSLVKLFRDSFAAGVNTLVIHGYPYSGTYPGTTWPGYTPFQYQFSEMWGPRQPAWAHFNDTLLFAARNTLVLKTGVPRVDVAVYAWQMPFTPSNLNSTGLEVLNHAGYTHEYVGGDNLVQARASAKDGVLGPDGPAYKALVVFDHQQISAAASAALLDLAAAKLPIIVVQSPANASAAFTTIGTNGQAAVSANLQQLLNGSFASVTAVSRADFAASTLLSAGIAPRVQVDAITGNNGANNGTEFYTHWRSDAQGSKELVYILNRGPAATFTLSFSVSGQSVPYVLNAWTGEQSPLVVYARDRAGRLTTNVTLGQEQSTILAFVEAASPPSPGRASSVISHSANVANIGLDAKGRLDVAVRDNAAVSLVRSDGSVVAVPASHSAASSPANITLGPWHLSVESYAAPAELTTASVAANKTTITLPSPLATLVPWTQIAGLEQVSGLGTYTCTFTVPRGASPPDFVYTLHLTNTIAHTLRAFVNNVAVPAFDPAASSATNGSLAFANGRDISALLHDSADNEIRIEVSSTLFNAVKAQSGDVLSIGLGASVPGDYTNATWAEYGLVGDVVVQQWRRVVV